jgi:HEAT repeat protein
MASREAVAGMIELREASEDEMVLEFLRGEVDSPRYREATLAAIAALGFGRKELVDEADLTNDAHNKARASALARRGYDRRELLFLGFPRDMHWRRVQLEAADLGRLLYVRNCSPWLEITAGPVGTTYKVADGANNLDSEHLKNVSGVDLSVAIREIAASIRRGEPHAEIIAVARPVALSNTREPLVLLEGHARATAHVVASTPPTALLGTSDTISSWHFFSGPPAAA